MRGPLFGEGGRRTPQARGSILSGKVEVDNSMVGEERRVCIALRAVTLDSR